MVDPPFAPAVKAAVTRALPAVTEVKVGADGATTGAAKVTVVIADVIAL
jgi:hypothetical protein